METAPQAPVDRRICAECGGPKKAHAKKCRACYYARGYKICSEPSCTNFAVAKGLCNKHRLRLRRNGITERLCPCGAQATNPTSRPRCDKCRAEGKTLTRRKAETSAEAAAPSAAQAVLEPPRVVLSPAFPPSADGAGCHPPNQGAPTVPLYRAIEPFFPGNSPEAVNPDVLYAADHPFVVKFPSMFVEVKVMSRGGEVEAATAAPGEKRPVGRPPGSKNKPRE